MSECKHPNFFWKEWKFYCRTCGEEEPKGVVLGKEEDFQEKHRESAYNITHCIHCGRKDFESFAEVLDHVRRECKKRKDL